MEENKDLIIVEQLPVIKEQLKKVAEEIDIKVEKAKGLVCTEENKQSVKNTRAEMKKELEQFEAQRKAVKEKVLAPYMQFEEVYKVCISDKYKSADKDLKEKIDAIEVEQKKRLEDGAKEYFEEYKQNKNIDFIEFKNMNLKIGLSDNPTKLKKQITAFIDKIEDDLKLIDIQEHKAEILVEYKQTLNVSNAITTVANRFKAIEEEKVRQEQIVNQRLEQEERLAKEAIKPFEEAKQKNEELQKQFNKEIQDTQINQKTYTITFKVTGTATRLKQLKDYLIREGYQYE